MGPPVFRSGGRSTWHCPFHDDRHPSFCTLPPREGYKDRYRCFSCGARGDAPDLMKHFYEGEDWPRRRLRLEQWQRQYEAGHPQQLIISHRGRGSTLSANHICVNCRLRDRSYDPTQDEFELAANKAMTEIFKVLAEFEPADEIATLTLLKRVLEIAAKHGLHPATLAGRCGFEGWSREVEAEHMAECMDPECECICCRAKRGLPPLGPLTSEQREARRHAKGAK